jgi:hypothetical protein
MFPKRVALSDNWHFPNCSFHFNFILFLYTLKKSQYNIGLSLNFQEDDLKPRKSMGDKTASEFLSIW